MLEAMGFCIFKRAPEVVMVESQAEKSIPLVSKVIEKLKKN